MSQETGWQRAQTAFEGKGVMTPPVPRARFSRRELEVRSSPLLRAKVARLFSPPVAHAAGIFYENTVSARLCPARRSRARANRACSRTNGDTRSNRACPPTNGDTRSNR